MIKNFFKKQPFISIVIPCYQEEKRLPNTLEKFYTFSEKLNISFELILVIEPSKDNTLPVAKQWQKEKSEIKILENEKRLGKGGSVQRGMLQAKGDYIAFMDADGSTDFEFLIKAIKILSENESKIVIASRSMKESVINTKQSIHRTQLGSLFRFIVNKTFKFNYRDTQCGFKFFHKDTVEVIFNNITEKGFAFDLEILLKAQKNGFSVKEIPCIWEDREGSTVNVFKDGFSMLKAVYKLKQYKDRGLL